MHFLGLEIKDNTKMIAAVATKNDVVATWAKEQVCFNVSVAAVVVEFGKGDGVQVYNLIGLKISCHGG